MFPGTAVNEGGFLSDQFAASRVGCEMKMSPSAGIGGGYNMEIDMETCDRRSVMKDSWTGPEFQILAEKFYFESCRFWSDWLNYTPFESIWG